MDTLSQDSWLPLFLQTADSQFPSGAYAHSFGLEGTVDLGLVHNAESLKTFLLTELAETLACQELPYLRFAVEACQKDDLEDLFTIDAEINAWRLTKENRNASVSLGKQRLSMLGRLYPDELFSTLDDAVRSGAIAGHQITILAAQSRVLGIPLTRVLSLHLYQSFSNAVQASSKLLRLGQECIQKLLRDCLVQSRALIEESLGFTRENAGCTLIACDIASSRHETAFSRLFIS